jgi:hypothetical protein
MISQAFEALMAAFCCESEIHKEIPMVRASTLLPNAKANLKFLRYLLSESLFEPFGNGRLDSLCECVTVLEQQYESLRSMASALCSHACAFDAGHAGNCVVEFFSLFRKFPHLLCRIRVATESAPACTHAVNNEPATQGHALRQT